MSFFLAYKVPYERSRPGRGGRLRQPHRARRVDLDVDVVELAAGPLVGRRRRVRGRHGLRPQELLAELDAATPTSPAKHASASPESAMKTAGMAFSRGVGASSWPSRARFRRCRCRSAASARPGGRRAFAPAPPPGGRRGASAPGAFCRGSPGRARRSPGGAAAGGRPVPSRAPPAPARTPAVGGAAAAAVAFVAFAPRCRRASSARVRLWRCTSWACLMAVACWARARARGARFPACGAPPTEARSARGVFPGAGCALGAAWLTVVTCPAPGGASAAATARRDIMRVISTELIFF